MSEQTQPGRDRETFYLRSIFPDAEAIFSARYRPLEQIQDHADIFLDASALLAPYAINQQGLQEIRETYKRLIAADRLFIPGRAAREFARNRARKIRETYQRIEQRPPRLKLQLSSYPLLQSLEEYLDVVQLKDEYNEVRDRYSEAVSKLLECVSGWTWDDPVSTLYSELFNKDVIVDPSFDKREIDQELARRDRYKIPPGYKDSDKPDGGAGDLIIWYTILEMAKDRKQSVIFVSGDQKADWRHTISDDVSYARIELLEEFRRHSDGQTFHILDFSDFLDLYGASDEVVEQARRGEDEARLVRLQTRATPSAPCISDEIAVDRVTTWLSRRFQLIIYRRQGSLPGLYVARSRYRFTERSIGLIVRSLDEGIPFYQLRQIVESASEALDRPGVSHVVVCFTLSDYESAERAAKVLETVHFDWMPSGVSLAIFYLSDSGRLIDVYTSLDWDRLFPQGSPRDR